MKLLKKINKPFVLVSLLIVGAITLSLLSASNASFVLAQSKPLPPMHRETVNFNDKSSAAEEGVNEDLEKDASTDINVKNADIAAIVKVFSKKTKRNLRKRRRKRRIFNPPNREKFRHFASNRKKSSPK